MNSVERGNLGYKPRTLSRSLPNHSDVCFYPDAVNFQLDELRQVFILAVNIHHPTLLYSLQLSAGGIEDVPRIDYIARMQIVSELAQDKCVQLRNALGSAAYIRSRFVMLAQEHHFFF